MGAACNICGGRRFGDTYGQAGSAFLRQGVRCLGCDSLERHRLLYERLERGGFLSRPLAVLHIAPEPCLVGIFRASWGRGYHPADRTPAQVPVQGVARLDLCTDAGRLGAARYDLVIHNHVLEHVDCDYRAVARALHAALKPGGWHIFSIPFMNGGFREAQGPLESHERTRRFGQADHMRIFSPDDLATTLGAALPLPPDYDATRGVAPERLVEIGIPEAAWRGFNNNALFMLEASEPAPSAGELPSPAPAQREKAPRRCRDVLFVSANGVGQGHLSRQLAIATRLKDYTAGFLTFSYSARIVREAGFAVHYLPHHAATGEDTRHWNARLANEIDLLLDARGSDALVYDVNFVFDGVIDVLRRRKDLRSIWIRRAMWPDHHADYLGAGIHFDTIVEPGDFAEAFDRGPTVAARQHVQRVAPVLLTQPHHRLGRDEARAALGLAPSATTLLLEISRPAGHALAGRRTAILDRLSRETELEIVELVSPLIEADATDPGPRHRRISLYPAYPYTAAFDMAITRAGYNVFHEAIAAALPTLFVPDEGRDMDLQINRARFAEENGLALCLPASGGAAETEDVVSRLLDDSVRKRLASNCRAFMELRGGFENGADAIARLVERAGDET
ncbi:methyltransferase domain-containing protein [Rhizobium sp. SG2393]|uniref:methyltransferase domain-containing protein n=1 Tax=Rhizobium sp. SG2393 TaxID=3276279 RepID=UPI0036734D95